MCNIIYGQFSAKATAKDIRYIIKQIAKLKEIEGTLQGEMLNLAFVLRFCHKPQARATSRALSLQQIQSLSQVLFASHRVPGAKFPTYQSHLQSAEPMNGQELLLQAGAKVGSAQRSRVFVLHLEWAMLKCPRQAVYQRSAFTTSGWRMPCVTRRMLKADSTKEHDAPLAPLAASTCVLRTQLFAKPSKPLQWFCGSQT